MTKSKYANVSGPNSKPQPNQDQNCRPEKCATMPTQSAQPMLMAIQVMFRMDDAGYTTVPEPHRIMTERS